MTRPDLILILGGARSGKSTYAQRLAEQRGDKVLFVATATASDEDMAQRIANHRSSRPQTWRTLEVPLGVGAAIQNYAPPGGFVVLDCVTLLANNVLFSLPEPVSETAYQAAMDGEIDRLLAAWRQGDATWAIVTNEVGLGLVPPYPLGRLYRDVLGRANQRLAQAATRVVFIAAGLPLMLKGGGADLTG